MDRNEANLIQKKIDDTQTALKVPDLKVSTRRQLLRRLEGLKFESNVAVNEQYGVIV